ncbi:unnamed protein product [Thelazia callipaeda]|uniref:Uncharacterized protein n=1 Tax=Thelazia callipaeda TaxID=103827 RepID=A0A0N5CNC2_THECL|nr:unnamed protein product [Thelazia callipaeda]
MICLSLFGNLTTSLACSPGFFSYHLARFNAKRNYDQAVDKLYVEHFEKPKIVLSPKIDTKFAKIKAAQLRPVKEQSDRPRCQQCKMLQSVSSFWSCPIHFRKIRCKSFTAKYSGNECLTANVTCTQPNLSHKALASYLTVIGDDLTNKEHVMHILQYDGRHSDNTSDIFDDNNLNNKKNFKGNLICDDSERWIIHANNRKYNVELLYCLVSDASNLVYVKDLFAE